jgi:arylformamidase
MEWIDISVPLKTGMVHWPDDPEVSIKRISDVDKGDKNTLSEIHMGAHTGTHMDAPLHFVHGGKGIDLVPLDSAMGNARIIEIEDDESIKVEQLQKHDIARGERILFKTKNSSHVWQRDDFAEDFVYISTEAAKFLVERGVILIGVDYLSVGGYKSNGSEVHQALLGAGIWLIEGLDLSKVSAGEYELVCLPLKIVDGDGAPARAVVRPLAGRK